MRARKGKCASQTTKVWRSTRAVSMVDGQRQGTSTEEYQQGVHQIGTIVGECLTLPVVRQDCEMEESIRNHGTRQQMNDGYIWGSKEPCTVHRLALTTPKGCSLCTWQTHTSMSLESNRLEGVVTGCGRHQLPQSKKRIDRQEANVIPSGLVSYPSGKKTGSKRITEES